MYGTLPDVRILIVQLHKLRNKNYKRLCFKKNEICVFYNSIIMPWNKDLKIHWQIIIKNGSGNTCSHCSIHFKRRTNEKLGYDIGQTRFTWNLVRIEWPIVRCFKGIVKPFTTWKIFFWSSSLHGFHKIELDFHCYLSPSLRFSLFSICLPIVNVNLLTAERI